MRYDFQVLSGDFVNLLSLLAFQHQGMSSLLVKPVKFSEVND